MGCRCRGTENIALRSGFIPLPERNKNGMPDGFKHRSGMFFVSCGDHDLARLVFQIVQDPGSNFPVSGQQDLFAAHIAHRPDRNIGQR